MENPYQHLYYSFESPSRFTYEDMMDRIFMLIDEHKYQDAEAIEKEFEEFIVVRDIQDFDVAWKVK